MMRFVLGFLFFFATGVAQAAEWRNIGECSYTGTLENALKLLAFPSDEFRIAFRQKVRQQKPEAYTLRRGDIIPNGMMSCKGLTKGPVTVAFDNEKADAWIHAVGEQECRLVRPHKCNNWFALCGKKIPIKESALPDSRPTYVEPVRAPEDHTIIIRLWHGGAAGDLAPFDGSQSRDLGRGLRRSWPPRYEKCSPKPFLIELREANMEAARDLRIRVNGGEAQTLGHRDGRNAIEVNVCNGIGTLTLVDKLAWMDKVFDAKKSSIRIVSPWVSPDLTYPDSGTLRTCSSEEIRRGAGHCGQFSKRVADEKMEFGEIFDLVSRFPTSNYHFNLR